MRARVVLLLAAAALLAPAAVAVAQSDPLREDQWGLDMIRSDPAHAVSTGEGAVVAVVDTGVHSEHADLGGRVLQGYDFVDQNNEPQDENGHGTHVAGIIAANAGNNVGVSSVAPRARVLAIRVLDFDGSGSNEDVAAGIDFARTSGAAVINLSLGEDVPLSAVGIGSEVDAAIDRALDAGIVVVAAAGNNGAPICQQPSGRGRLLCVGSVDRREKRSYFSNFGQGLGIMAPGGSGAGFANEDILSTYLFFDLLGNAGGDNDYEELAGTSQATPHVAGVAALLVARGVRGQDAVRRILATARDAGLPGPDPDYGAGIVDARAAVASTVGAGGTGTGGGGSTGGASAGSAASVSVPRVQRIRSVLKRGILVRCRAAGAGRCSARAAAGRRRIAAGSKAVQPGVTVSVRAKVSRSGRRFLRGKRRVRVTVRVTLPGAATQVRRVTLKR